MFRFFSFTALVCFLFLFSCEQDTEIGADLLLVKRSQISEVDRIVYNDTSYIDSCVFVLLETSVESIVGEVTQLQTFDGNYFILDKQTRKVKVFDSTGKYLFDVGTIGGGPGEYTSINAFVVNPIEQKIALFDPMRTAVHEYTLNGVFLQTVTHHQREFSHFQRLIYAGDVIYCFSGINWQENTTFSVISSNDYSVQDRIRQYPVKPNQQLGFSPMDNPFSLVDESLYYVSLFSDTIYKYESGIEMPYMLIETGKPNIPTDYLANRNLKSEPVQAFFDVWRDDNYSAGFTEIGKTDRFVLAGFKFGEAGYGGSIAGKPFYLYDKKKNECFFVNNQQSPDLGLPSFVEENRLIKVWTPDEIDSYIELVKEGNITAPEYIKSLLSEYDPEYHNPILIIYYMKN